MAERRGPAIPRAVAWHSSADGTLGRARVVELHGFAKETTTDDPNLVANEFVAHRIGLHLGLPVVPGAPMLLPNEDRVGWVSLSFDGNASKSLPSARPERIVADYPDTAAGVVIFDLLIANVDRHRDNLAFRRTGRKGMSLALFDHGHALWGSSGLSGAEHLKRIDGRFLLEGGGMSGLRQRRHCLLDHVSSSQRLLKWCDEAKSLLPDEAINAACREAAQLPGVGVRHPDDQFLARFLSKRRNDLERLISENRRGFPNVQDWGL